MGQNIAILGAGGFLGSHITAALIARGHRVHAADHCLAKLSMTHERLHRHERDVRDAGFQSELLAEVDTVLSLTAICQPAAYNTQPLAVIRASYDDLVSVVQRAAESSKRLIHFSTCEVYGRAAMGADGPMTTMNEQDSSLLLGPVHMERWTYACAKQLLERTIWAQGRHAGLAFTIVRPFNVIGARMDHIPGVDGEGVPRVLACFMHALLSGRDLLLVNGGSQRRSFVYIDDFVEAVLRVVDRPRQCNGQIINIGAPDNDISIADLADRLIAAYRERVGPSPSAVRQVSAVDFYGDGYDDTQVRIPDIGAAQRLLDWQPHTSVDAMLAPIIDDYVKRYGTTLAEATPQ